MKTERQKGGKSHGGVSYLTGTLGRKKEPQHHHKGSKPIVEKSHVHRSHTPDKAVADEEKQNQDPSWHSLTVSSKHTDLCVSVKHAD